MIRLLFIFSSCEEQIKQHFKIYIYIFSIEMPLLTFILNLSFHAMDLITLRSYEPMALLLNHLGLN